MSGIALLSGSNVLTVTARDAAGNTSTDTLTVTYTPPATPPPGGDDHGADECGDVRDGDNPLTLSGTASDNVGVTQVTWVNDRGGVGHGDRHDELERERDRAAERFERADGDGARCGRQHQHR